MRRHLPLTFTLALAVTGLTAAGIAMAGPATAGPKPHTAIKIVSGSACKPAASFCYKPSTRTIAPGTKVTWKNTTFAPHTVTRCTVAACGVSGGTGTDTGPASASISQNGKYSLVFHGSGTYVFYCQVHGYALMHGTITVT